MPSVEELVKQGKQDCRDCTHNIPKVERLDYCNRFGDTLKEWKCCEFERMEMKDCCGQDAKFFKSKNQKQLDEQAERKAKREALLEKYPNKTIDEIVEAEFNKSQGFFGKIVLNSLSWWSK